MIGGALETIAADKPSPALAKPVLVLTLRIFSAHNTPSQFRLIAGKGKQTELKYANKLFPEGRFVKERKEAHEKRKQFPVALPLCCRQINQFTEITRISKQYNITVDMGVGVNNLAVIQPHQGRSLLFKKAKGAAGKGFKTTAKSLPAPLGSFGDAPQFTKISGKKGNQLIPFCKIEAMEDHRRVFIVRHRFTLMPYSQEF